MNIWIQNRIHDDLTYSTTFDLRSLCEWGNCIVQTIEWNGTLLRFEVQNIGPLEYLNWYEEDQKTGGTDMYYFDEKKEVVFFDNYQQKVSNFGIQNNNSSFPYNIQMRSIISCFY